jgi:hypothetical protein
MINVHPATVTITFPEPVGTVEVLKQARVRTNNAANERIQVWVEDPQTHKPSLVINGYVSEIIHDYNMWAPQQDRTAAVMLEGGTRIDIKAEGGCGCSSPLRNLPTWRLHDHDEVATA